MLQAGKSKREMPHPRSEDIYRIAENSKLRVQAKLQEEAKRQTQAKSYKVHIKGHVWPHPFYNCISQLGNL